MIITPKLSICIATYNRAKFISETLDSIVKQISSEVEIVIVDGASTDNTSVIVKKYQSIYNQIKYFQLSEKGGVDQDYSKAVSFATGTMCWLFTDDDTLKDNALEIVLKLIDDDYSLLIINSEIKNLDLKETISERRMLIERNKIFHENEIDNLFNCIVPYISFIGCVVIKRSLWIEREQKKYFGTEFIHVGVIFQYPIPGKTIVISNPLINIRMGNAQWSPRSFEIWMIKWPSLLTSFEKVSPISKNKFKHLPSIKTIRLLCVHRSEGNYDYYVYKKWYSKQHNPYWWKLILIFISLLPMSFTKLIVNGFVSVKKYFLKFVRKFN